MRVAEVFIKYPPAVGGHEKYVQELAEGLARSGVETHVLTSNLRSHRIATENPLTRRVVLPELKGAFRALRPDVIHAHDIWRQPTEMAMESARELGIPLVLNPCFHDRSSERCGNRWRTELARIVAKIPAGTRVLFNTRWEKVRLEELGFRFESVGYLPPAVDLDEIDRIPQDSPAGLSANQLVILYVGRFAPEKGIETLLQSFVTVVRHFLRSEPETARRLHLVLAGFRDTDDDFERLASRFGVREQTTFLYDQPRAAIINLMRRADLFVLPSRAETFGIVVIEAWATGNLVITSNHAALPYLVQHEYNGLVCPDHELSGTMIGAIKRRETNWARTLAARGRTTVEREYTRERQIQALVGFLSEAVRLR